MMNYLRSGKLLAMYSSYLSAIIKDESLMLVPIDDHLIHRGHGVVSNILVINGRIYNLSSNVTYLYRIAKNLKIHPPLSELEICQVLKDLASSTQEQNICIQLYLTAGAGNMTIVPLLGQSIVYATAWEIDPIQLKVPKHEYTSQFPISAKFQSQVQNCHYLVNVFTRLNSTSNGGTFGLALNEKQNFVFGGFLSPAFISNKNLIFLKSDNNFPILKTLESFGQTLVNNGKLNNVEFREDINVNEFYEADEGLLIGQDFITGIISLDNKRIGREIEGEEGITKTLQMMLDADYLNPERTVEVDYSSYS